MKNPSIFEGGIARAFSGIKKLFTRQSGSDDLIAWVPESDRQLTTKYITQNGVYRASDDGYYAYSSVTVNVSTTDSVTGKDPVTGEDVVVKPDPETGELVETVVPSSIQITTPPTFTGPYGDGAYISFDGMVVKAYKGDGTLWTDENHPDGVIPFEELILPMTIAHYDGSGGSEMTDDEGLNAVVGLANGDLIMRRTARRVNVNGHICIEGGFTVILTYYNGTVYFARYGGEIGVTLDSTGASSAGVWGNITYSDLFARLQPMERMSIPESTVDPAGKDVNTMHPATGTPVPVQWQRPGDNAVLETSFDISVVDITPGGQGED